MKVVFLPEVEEYLFEVMEILYEKEYFGFKDSAVQYVEDLVFDISNNLNTSTKRVAPEHFSMYGKGLYYALFKKNKGTQWYVFFTTYNQNGELIYLVRYISNNHVISQHL